MTYEHEVRTTSEQFYTAANAVLRGDAAPMLAVWSHGEEATYCDPRGEIVRGWPALEQYWKEAAAMNAAAPGQLTTTGKITHAVVSGDLAYVVALEEVQREGETTMMLARATLVYRRERLEGWRLLHRHTDAAPISRELPYLETLV
jgi:ketosteroid isomerase-like protein